MSAVGRVKRALLKGREIWLDPEDAEAMAKDLVAKFRPVIETAEQLTAAIDGDTTAVFRDEGGFVWWSDEDRHGTKWLVGVATPMDPDDHGLATRAWINKFRPADAIEYGPFTIIDGGKR